MKSARVLTALAVIAGAATVGVSANANPQTNDVDLLNYALQLEYLELAFYNKGLAQYSATDFNNAQIATSVYEYMQLIQAHEQAHVNFISGALGSSAQPNCTAYSFSANGFTSVNDFVSQAITLEDVGVTAYAGALNAISDIGTQQAAATIATVEARHAAFLRNAVGNSTAGTKTPFPDAVNQQRTPAQVIDVAGPYFASANGAQCTYNIILPTVRPAGVATENTLANSGPSSTTPTTPAPVYTQKQLNDDVGVLNYALTLEHFEADFYNTFAARFSAAELESATGLSGQGAAILTNLDLVKQHENGHVKALTGYITARNAIPVTAGCYDWSSITTASQMLGVAATLENTGVSAYDGAANNITDTGLQQIAAAVAVVEARHAAYLNVLNKQSASQLSFENGNFDQALTPSVIVSAVRGLPSSAMPYARALTGGCPSSSSSTGHNGAASSSAAPIMMVSAALAFVAALLF